jgi:hypothetical protein
MLNIVPDESAMSITQTTKIIETDNAILELKPGTIWTYLKQDGEVIGIAFQGDTRFVVDAITHTPSGAMGRSMNPELEGVQIILGDFNLEHVSSVVSQSDFSLNNLDGLEGFMDAIKARMKKWNTTDSKIDRKDRDGTLFFGWDTEDKSILLVSKESNLVFTYDKQVTVLGTGDHVSVTEQGVSIGGKGGQTMTITKDGIHGLDNYIDIDQVVRGAVAGVAKGLKGLKHLKKLKHGKNRRTAHWYGPRYSGKYHGAWESVDDFDWPD